MRRGMAVSAIALAMSMVAAPASAGTHGPRVPAGPNGVTVEIVTVNGSGCPAGTVAVAVSEDSTAFTVTYSNYLARAGGTSDPVDFRKNCQLNLIVHVPQGFTYGIAAADYRGFASLEQGANGVEKASYYFQGDPTTTAISHQYTGAYADNWQSRDEVPFGQIVYKPCGEQRNFNVNTEVRVNLGTSDKTKVSFMTMDSTDGSLKTIYHFAWKTCP
ncbi:DUF4360 domain-containing protein [Actinomadura barringtoniae]|uniref:DUF4360 domain-containing protein n=1 Tax=Actinomadura barringtoniae TaxID=1427535 RepID=A0A939T158_9ACTN|nr:DUF4360 domain-containing protein [Actinomadura barringtoniae]MBO2446841.1 DUF4360 domain-containing protein [Actinomadura barringtoniae]